MWLTQWHGLSPPYGFLLMPVVAIIVIMLLAGLGRMSRRSSDVTIRLAKYIRLGTFTLYFNWLRKRIPSMELHSFESWTPHSSDSVKLGIFFSYFTLVVELMVVSIMAASESTAKVTGNIGLVFAYAVGEIYINGINFLLGPPSDIKAVITAELEERKELFKVFKCNDTTLTLTRVEAERLIDLAFRVNHKIGAHIPRHIQAVYVSDKNLYMSWDNVEKNLKGNGKPLDDLMKNGDSGPAGSTV